MCPPSWPPPPAEIGLYWSDEQIISILDDYTPGSRLPDNVLADSSPYQFQPSNLPEGFWFIVHSNEKKESIYGFWKAKGQACKVYSNSRISGWRSTLEYFEGQAPHGRRTDWLMQEYRVTQTESRDKDKPKESNRLLCRVFLCDGHSSESEPKPKNCKTDVLPKKAEPVASVNPNNNITSSQDSRRESKAKGEGEVGLLPAVVDNYPNLSVDIFSELECLAKGDYLELNDLEDPESHSSSSQNSSCPSKLSDEYFDSSAFLRDIEEEEKKLLREQQSSSRYTFATSVRSNDIVLQPPSSGSLLSNVVEDSRSIAAIHESLGPSTSQTNMVPRGEKKSSSHRMKKLKTYFCFTSF